MSILKVVFAFTNARTGFGAGEAVAGEAVAGEAVAGDVGARDLTVANLAADNFFDVQEAWAVGAFWKGRG